MEKHSGQEDARFVPHLIQISTSTSETSQSALRAIQYYLTSAWNIIRSETTQHKSRQGFILGVHNYFFERFLEIIGYILLITGKIGSI